MRQTRKTQKLLANGMVRDPRVCRHCGRRAKGSTGVCREPRCVTRQFFLEEGE